MPGQSIGSPALWAGFVAFVIAMLALDLGVLHRQARAVTLREALMTTGGWVSCAFVFGLGLHWKFGAEPALQFATGYLIEKALALDNVLVFAVIFGYFGVPAAHQHRVLFWGVFGALVMRAVFIWLGSALIERFHWVLYVFGAALIFTGIKLFRQRDEVTDPGERAVVRWFRRFVPLDADHRGPEFVVRRGGRWMATPLLLVVVVLEFSDVMFAIDSIPAIFAVTLDPFLVFTSNIFAILGLRSLYFLLSKVIDRFRYLNYGLSAVLCFVGIKMLLAEVFPIGVGASLAVIGGLLTIAVVASVVLPRAPGSGGSSRVARTPT